MTETPKDPLNPERPDEDYEMVEVFKTFDQTELRVVEGLLLGEGLQVEVRGLGAGGLEAAFVQVGSFFSDAIGYELYVPAMDLERAQRILDRAAEAAAELPDDGSSDDAM